jgi:hypothetical protein
MEQAYQYVHSLLPGITQFRIYHDNETLLENGGLLWKPGNRLLDGQAEKEWYEQHLNDSHPHWTVYIQPFNGETYSTLTHSIPRGTAGCVGVLYLRVSNSYAFNSIWKSSGISGARHALTDDQGTIFLSTDSQLIGNRLADSDFEPLEEVRISSPDTDTFFRRMADGYMIFHRIENGWRLYSYIPMSDINQDMEYLNKLYSLVLLAVLVLGSCAALTIFHYYRHRLKRLIKTLEIQVPAAAASDLKPGGLKDHVTQVEAYYGRMIQQMKDLKLREMEEAVRAIGKLRRTPFPVQYARPDPLARAG